VDRQHWEYWLGEHLSDPYVGGFKYIALGLELILCPMAGANALSYGWS